MRLFAPCLLLTLLDPSLNAAPPTFLVRKANGTEIRAPLASMDANFRIEVGTKILRKFGGDEWLSIRQAGLDLPPLPSDEQIVLTSGDRIPARNLRLDDEKLRFRHPDLNGNKDSIVPIASVAMIWRLAPDGTLNASTQRNRLLRTKRKRDSILLRNGDMIEGTLEALSTDEVEVEIARKKVVTKWPLVCAVLLSTDLTEKARAKESQARLVLSSTDRSPGGRLTVVAPSCDGVTFSAKTTFGAVIRVPIERVVSLELSASHIVRVSDLTPSKVTYTPYLDEKVVYSIDANVLGRDLLLGGSYYDKGVGMHAGSQISYPLDGKYRRFEALVGLDDLDGREGNVRIRVLLDGKAVDLGKSEWTGRDKGVRISVDVAGAKEMTLVVESAAKGPIQGVVDVVEARLIRDSP
jgi:NPCBM/NEW2 domain